MADLTNSWRLHQISEDEYHERLREADASAAFALYDAAGHMARLLRVSADTAVAMHTLSATWTDAAVAAYRVAGEPYGPGDENAIRWWRDTYDQDETEP